MKKSLLVALALLVASLALAACGGSDDSSETTADTQAQTGGAEAEGGSAGSASVLDFEAAEGSALAYTTDSAEAKTGKVTVNFTNPQAVPHDVAIEDSAGEQVVATDLVTEGSDSVEVELEPAAYTFYCTVPGHREAGMEGDLTVK